MQHFEILKLFSDIGGAAGLMLGMSFATVIGIIDWLISFLTNLLMGRYRTVRRLTRKYSEVVLTIIIQVSITMQSHIRPNNKSVRDEDDGFWIICR